MTDTKDVKGVGPAMARELASRGITTAKDLVRLQGGHGRGPELAARTEVLEVRLDFDQPQTAAAIVRQAIEKHRRRRATGQTS